MAPQFSIVTPCFNSRKVLPQCVGSVRGQTEVSCEHIIQDGLSKDGTAEWASGQKDLLFQSEKDKGMYDAINKGWGRAQGEIFSYLNADEQYLPGALARVAQTFREHPDADIVHADTIIVAPDGRPLAARREIPLRAAYVRNKFLYTLSCSLFYHRRLFEKGLLTVDPDYRNAGDTEMVLRLLDAGAKPVQIRAYTSLFGVDGNNITIDGNSKMDVEMKRIRAKFHALPPPLRQTIMLGRYIERVLSGCYASDTLTYDFALDEKPTYKRIENVRTGSRFTFARAVRQLQAMK
jgi:glycosyltransferase involved in cell wall biosynthesis